MQAPPYRDLLRWFTAAFLTVMVAWAAFACAVLIWAVLTKGVSCL